jgi:starch phosphorylase
MNMRVAGYEPSKFYESNSELKRVIDALSSNYFNKSEPGIFQPIVEELLGRDYFFVMADYASYINMQDRAANDYLNRHNWITRSILNSARSGWFSSDRTIREYAGEIWKIKPVSND